MADSLENALAMLRELGPARFGRFAADRLLGFWRTWRWVARLPPESTEDVLEEIIDVVTHRRLGAGQPVFAMQQPQELRELLKRIRALAPRTVLEIGTAAGGTLLLLARVTHPNGIIVSVDLPGGAFGGGYAAWRSWLYRAFASPGQALTLLRGDSHHPGIRRRVTEIFGGRPIDLLLIDGDHTYEGARQDYSDYAPLVRAGGIVAFHDICSDPAQPDLEVPRLWEDLRTACASEELIQDRGQAGYGLGLLYLPATQLSLDMPRKSP
jgi:predicted O-methyltransferase YrrM